MIALMLASLMLQPVSCDAFDAEWELAQCLRRDYERADKALTGELNRVTALLRAADVANGLDRNSSWSLADRFTEAQDAWRTHRDAHCSWEGWAEMQGSGSTMGTNRCMSRITRERIAFVAGVTREWAR